MRRSIPTCSRAAIALVYVTLLGGGLTVAAWKTGLFFASGSSTQAIHASYPFDVSNRQKLVGAASNVFVGRVIALAGTQGLGTSTPGYQVPQTQFQVEVLESIKGHVETTVLVNQHGGPDSRNPNHVALFEADPLLTPGETYLFTTYHNPQTGWYQIIAPGYANIHLKDQQERTTTVAQFKQAVEH